MSIPVACQCGKKFSAPPKLMGKRVKCPGCSQPIQIPAQPQSSAPASQVTVSCSGCGGQFQAKPELVGRQVSCPTCGTAIHVGANPSQNVAPPTDDPLGIAADLSSSSTLPTTFQPQPKSSGIDPRLKRILIGGGIGAGALVVLILVAIFAVRGISQVAQSIQDAKEPQWDANPELLSQVQDEQTVGGFAIRPASFFGDVGTDRSESNFVLRDWRIEQVQIFDRVVGTNPLAEDTNRTAPELDPETWRVASLRMDTTTGDVVHIQLARPLAWFERHGAAPGQTIDLNLPELGAVGPAHLLAVDPCPTPKSGPGNLVTATFRHSSDNVIDLYVEGSDKPIGTTGNHPFWSEDRGRFIWAEELHPEEQVQTVFGLGKVRFHLPRQTPKPVYNIEVHCEHVYQVGQQGVLVHNSRADDVVEVFTGTSRQVDLHRAPGPGSSGGFGGTHVTSVDITNPQDLVQIADRSIPGSHPDYITRIEVPSSELRPDPTGDIFPDTAWIPPTAENATITGIWEVIYDALDDTPILNQIFGD